VRRRRLAGIAPRQLAAALAVAVALSIISAGGQAAAPGSNVPDVETRRSGLQLMPMPRTAQLYATNCQGCHGEFGSSAAEIPTLAGRVGYFTRSQEGRRYLVQVPNVALNANSDADIAAVLNWLLATYSRAQLPADFKPYTAGEVGELRQARIDVVASRRRVIDALVATGQIPSADTLALPQIVLY
jgi:mono/diheme cytochrome c family protein